jgi:hypothetical protein
LNWLARQRKVQKTHKVEEEGQGEDSYWTYIFSASKLPGRLTWSGSCTSHEDNGNVLEAFDPVSRVRVVELFYITVITTCTAYFNIQILCMLLTKYIYDFEDKQRLFA